MAENLGDGTTKRTLGTRARDDAWAHLVRLAATAVVTPTLIAVVGWLIVDKVNGIDQHIRDHDTEFEKLEATIGQIAANQSAGQAQRDAQQKQMDSFSVWLARLSTRIDNLKH